MALRLLTAFVVLAFAVDAHAANADAKPPSCKDLGYEDSLALHPDAFGAVDIELAFDDYRSWVKKKIKTYVSLAKRGHARKRKRNSGLITVHTRGGISCTLRAEVRAHGDLSDHYPGNLDEEPSLNIKLVDGHIFGITKFILFRPETRFGENEVFVTTLLSELGFLSPRSSMSTFNITGSDKPPVKVIFQEKIVKEFLEANSVREGPVIEGDERFAFGHRYEHLKRGAALARVSNFKWALKGPTSMAIAHRAVEQMSRLFYRYDKSWATIHGSNMIDIIELTHLLDGPDSSLRFVDVPVFEAIVFSTGATHGFSQDDRRHVFDPLTNSFTPIYYDGGATVLTDPQKGLDRSITMTAQKNVDQAKMRLQRLDLTRLQKALDRRDVNVSLGKLDETLAAMRQRLDWMATTKDVEPVKIKPRTVYAKPGNRVSYVFATDNADSYEVCSDSLTACRLVARSPKLTAKLVAQEWVDDQGYPGIYFSFPKSELDRPFEGFGTESQADIRHQSFDVPGFRLDLYGDISGKVDVAGRAIELSRFGASGRAVVSNGKLRDWSVSLTDVSGHVKNEKAGEQNFDHLGLTGCLTFTDVDVTDLHFKVVGATCEDGANFVRATGNVTRGEIVGAAFDALDADFSVLTFDHLRVDNAGNDCLDLSYGRYQAGYLRLTRCGDKAVSVGETSRAAIKELDAENVVIGLAAKDYGSIVIDSGRVQNSTKCFDLYNKKQEFSGGRLEITSGGRLDCNGVSGRVGPTSIVVGTEGS